MLYSKDEIMQFTREEDVKFIRLAFCDVFGRQKNISIMPDELPRAFEYGVAFDGSAIRGFGDVTHSDLLLHPEPDTLTALPWRPEHGRVVRMFSSITDPDGKPFTCDTRSLLKDAVREAADAGFRFSFGAEQEFYLFQLDERGLPTKTPYDTAGYMDIAPEDRGENVRREICLTLEQMGITPESSHHEAGPGQNEIDFKYADALTSADNTVTFLSVVRTIAARNGLYADFSPKPIADKAGSALHITVSIKSKSGEDVTDASIAGLLHNVNAMTVFLNPTDSSFRRFGRLKAPKYITWSAKNRAQLISARLTERGNRCLQLRSPDPEANPYLAYALMIYAMIDGIENKRALPPATDRNVLMMTGEELHQLPKLPDRLDKARDAALHSSLINEHIPDSVTKAYCSM